VARDELVKGLRDHDRPELSSHDRAFREVARAGSLIRSVILVPIKIPDPPSPNDGPGLVTTSCEVRCGRG
jgi:hypothetical protein